MASTRKHNHASLAEVRLVDEPLEPEEFQHDATDFGFERATITQNTHLKGLPFTRHRDNSPARSDQVLSSCLTPRGVALSRHSSTNVQNCFSSFSSEALQDSDDTVENAWPLPQRTSTTLPRISELASLPGPRNLNVKGPLPPRRCVSYNQPHASLSASERYLVFKVVKISNISGCDYRVGDLTMWLLFGNQALNLYVEVTLGNNTQHTNIIDAGKVGGQNEVSCAHTAPLPFAYQGEQHAQIVVRDQRAIQGAFRGNPRIGTADLQLRVDNTLQEGTMRTAHLELNGQGNNARGAITISYWLSGDRSHL